MSSQYTEDVPIGTVLQRRSERGTNSDPLLSVTQDKGVVLQENAGRRNISSADRTTYWRVYPDDIVYNTMRMWQGASARSDYFGVVSPAYTVCTPHEGISSDYIAYALKLPENTASFRSRSQGITSDVWNLRFRELARISMRVVRVDDRRRRIAGILSLLDESIEQTEALIAKTQQINAGLMHDLFTRGVTPDGQLRPPREEAPKLYKESPFGWTPKEWQAGRLSDKRRSGGPHLKTGPFGSSLKIEHWVDDGRPVITIGALGEGEFVLSELLHVSEGTAQRLRDYQLEVGDVVFSRVADVGRSATIGEEQKGWIISSNLMRISLDRGLVVPEFLQAQLAYDARVRRQIRATVNAGGRDVANSAILNRLRFSWPPKEEQERIVNRFARLVTHRQANVVSLEKLRLLKSGLMHDLLTGRVRVPVAQSQKASVKGAAPS